MIDYITILYALMGSLGFALFFNVARRHIITSTLDGVIGWVIYVLMNNLLKTPVFISALAAGLAVSIIAELFARWFKAPSTIFYIIGLIPLVPGSSLYYLTEALLKEDLAQAGERFGTLAWIILGVGAGAAVVLGVIWMTRRIKAERAKKKTEAERTA